MSPDCPCGSEASYSACCEPFHLKHARPETAEQLMRSRYSAYARQQIDYLVATTHPDKQTTFLRKEIASFAEEADFIRLEILSTWQGGPNDRVGKIEFAAHLLHAGNAEILHEVSRFRRHRGSWFYLDGTIKNG